MENTEESSAGISQATPEMMEGVEVQDQEVNENSTVSGKEDEASCQAEESSQDAVKSSEDITEEERNSQVEGVETEAFRDIAEDSAKEETISAVITEGDESVQVSGLGFSCQAFIGSVIQMSSPVKELELELPAVVEAEQDELKEVVGDSGATIEASEHEIGENGGKPSEVTVEGERGDVVGKEVEETHLDEETENNSGTEKSSDTTNEVKEPTSPEEQTDS